MTSSVHHLKEKTFRHITRHFYKLVKIKYDKHAKKTITTSLTYERHVEPTLHLLELMVDAAARPGQLSMLESGERLLLSAPVSVAPPPLPLTLPLPLPALLRDDGRGCNK